ncbi:MAG: AAA family ATPase [Geitlerinemataceae cyanobacterium]
MKAPDLEEIDAIARYCTAERPIASLLVLIGIPGSGKTTLACTLAAQWPNCETIATDAVRAELYGDARIQGHWPQIEAHVERRLAAIARRGSSRSRSRGHENSGNLHGYPATIYDATNVDRDHRRQAIARARACGLTAVLGLWLDVPLAVAIERNRRRSRRVPDAVLEAMHRALKCCPPHPDDGFDRLWRCQLV